jgi:protein TonB
MSHAAAALPPARLDAKRIAATSGAIAVHVAVLMMLMMPPELKTAEPEETVTEVSIDTPKPPPPPPPPPVNTPTQTIQHTVVPAPVSIPDPPVEPVDTTPSVVDYDAPPATDTPNTVTAVAEASPFQQLAVAVGAPPAYPKMAITRGIQGTVMLRIHVDANGKPMDVSIEQSSGSRILDEAAQKFVKAHWTFVPAQSGGQAVDAWGLVPIQFVLQQ